MATRIINLGNGETATAQGVKTHGFEDVVVDNRPKDLNTGYAPDGEADLWQIARDMGLAHPGQKIAHRRTDPSGNAAAAGEKTEPKIRVYTENGTGRIVSAEFIESEERKERPLTEYKSSYTEEVFSGIAAPHINQSGLFFTAYQPGVWDVGAFPYAILDENLSGLSVPVPQSIFEIIDASEGTEGASGSSFYNGAGTEKAPLKSIAQQEISGVLCASLSAEFEADQQGLTNILNILETAAGFSEGGDASNRIRFRGIRWGGMLQYDPEQMITISNGAGITVDLAQKQDPRVISPDPNGILRRSVFRMFMTYYQPSALSTGEWSVAITRITDR